MDLDADPLDNVSHSLFGSDLFNSTGTLNESFLSVEEYLSRILGPKRLPNDVVIPITIVYLLIFVSGVVGNVSVCVVIIRNACMHTATNYYLFSLAVSDLTILLLGLPNELSVYWQQYPWMFGEIVCKLRALVAEMTSYASVLTIVAFSLERYLAICHPLHAYTMSSLGRVMVIIALIWLVALISALPFAIFTTIKYIDYPLGSGHYLAESAFCATFDEYIPAEWPLYEMATFIFFIIPMAILTLLYLRIGIRIRLSSSSIAAETAHTDSRHTPSSRKTVLRMLVAVVIGFFICWAPFHTQRLLYVYAKNSPNFRDINEVMYYVAGCCYYFSATINPILYNVMSARYREAFRETLCSRSQEHASWTNKRGNSDRFSTASGGSYVATWNRHRSGTNRSRLGSTATGTSIISDSLPGVRRLSSRDSNNSWSSKDVVYLLRSSLRNGATKDSEVQEEMTTILEDASPTKMVVPVGECHAARENGLKTHNVTFNNEWRTHAKPIPKAGSGNASLRAGCTPSCLKSSQITRSLSETSRGAASGSAPGSRSQCGLSQQQQQQQEKLLAEEPAALNGQTEGETCI